MPDEMSYSLEPDVEKAHTTTQPSVRQDDKPQTKNTEEPASWDGDDDPVNPQNWPARMKWTTTILMAAFSFDTMMTATLIAPALSQIAQDLDVSSEARVQLMLSSYVLSYAFGPFLWGPLSELFGRVVVLQFASAWFFIWNMICGFAKTEGILIAGRVLSGVGAAGALAISTGVLSDCWRAEQRGRSLAIYTFIPLLGPAIGPILGGVMTQHSTWRWAFWSTSAFNAILQLLAIFILQETHHKTILRRRRQPVHRSLRPISLEALEIRHALAAALQRPFRLLASQLVILLLAIFSGISFGILYIYLSILPKIFIERYYQSSSVAGLNYISFGTGFLIGAQFLGYSTDVMYRKKLLRGTPIPELRLALLLPNIVIAAIGLLCLGWSAQARTHWIVPNLGVLLFATGIQFSTQCINAYVIEVYGPKGWSASAMAGIWALKSTAGFGFPLFAPDMVHVFGWGWSSSILAAALVAVGAPVSLSLQWYGDVFRRMGESRLEA